MSHNLVFSVRVSEEERALLEAASGTGARKSLSEFIRRKALDAAEIGRHRTANCHHSGQQLEKV